MLIFAILLLIAGLILMIFSAEKLVKGIVNVSVGFGISAFVLTAVFIGFDPENLAAGGTAAYQGINGIAIGSILGALMIPTALSFGLTAMIVRLRFKKVSKPIVLLPVFALLLLFILSLDGIISRIDGIILIISFLILVIYLLKESKAKTIVPAGEIKEYLEKKKINKWKALIILVLALLGIILGSEMLVEGAKTTISYFRVSETLFGMTIIAFLISAEELVKQIPAAIKGRPDISYGNMSGSVFHFLLLNAGIIALIHPIGISSDMLYFYFPIAFISLSLISIFMLKKDIPRYLGIPLVILYLIFVLKGYLF